MIVEKSSVLDLRYSPIGPDQLSSGGVCGLDELLMVYNYILKFQIEGWVAS